VFSRVVGALGRLLVLAGLFILGFVAFQLWGTGVEEARGQDELAGTLARNADGDADPSTVDLGALTEQLARVDPATAPATPPPPEGEPVGVIQIPAIGVERVVVEGVSKADLKKGPGHYPGTPLPGQAGNSGIAGHRTTYGAPFNRIDELVPGDQVVVTTPQGRFAYEVIEGPVPGQAWYAVTPSDVSVLDDKGDDRLTLTACHPKYSAQERIIVHARLMTPVAAAAPVEVVEQASTPAEGEVAAEEFDQGLGGDAAALVPALAFGIAALAVGMLAWVVGRRWHRVPAYLLATPMVLILVWFCYVNLDRYLPAL
jgi:sortase A